jgi:hypothetical protein
VTRLFFYVTPESREKYAFKTQHVRQFAYRIPKVKKALFPYQVGGSWQATELRILIPEPGCGWPNRFPHWFQTRLGVPN